MTDIARLFKSATVIAVLFSCFCSANVHERKVQLINQDERSLKLLRYACHPKFRLQKLFERHKWKPGTERKTRCQKMYREKMPYASVNGMQRSLKQTEELDSPQVKTRDDTKEEPLIAFRVIGCSLVTVLVGFTLIIYVTSGMFYHDCLAQICSEACILTAYTFILLTTTDTFPVEKGLCLSISFLLHFLFVGAFLFSLIEVVCICRLLLSYFPKTILSSTRNIMLWGWTLPATISGVSAIVWHDQYTTKKNCWINISKSPIWPTIIPIGVCVGLQVILLLLVLLVSEVPLSVPQDQYRRAKCYLNTRWASAVIVVMLIVSWSCGVIAYHRSQEMYYAAFTVASILLGVCIFILRISTDEEIRKIITANLLCFIVPSKSNKISSFSQKVLESKTRFIQEIPDHKVTNYGQLNGRSMVINHS